MSNFITEGVSLSFSKYC